jgi:tetratricopeptide (TPR) repeat protein
MVFAVLFFHSVPPGELPPPAPRDCFGRDELIESVVGFVENLEPIALIGAGGIGKTSIALTVLHHKRIEERFGEDRRFIRCDQFPASHTHFLARLSHVIGAGVKNPTDLAPLRRLLSSREMIIILDNAESILDPKGTSAKEIYSVVDELCQFKTICLCITSRITTVPPRCKRPEIPTLSTEAACDIFHGIYGGGRSSIINDLLERLDFHALSIKLLATTASHNGWDHNRLTEEWDEQRAQVLQTDYNESLAATIELSLTSPTFRSLGPDARDLLGVVAFFPRGVDEKNLNWLFPTIPNRKNLNWLLSTIPNRKNLNRLSPTIPNRKNVFDKFCALSLTYRSNGFITMLAPIRDYLGLQDPQSSPLLCTARDQYFNRLSVNLTPGKPGFDEAQWIVLEDVNVEHLVDVFTSIDQTGDDSWDACYFFMEHLVWHKPRQTILKSKIEALADDHPSKPKCLFRLSSLFQQIGNQVERKQLLTLALELRRQRGSEAEVARTLQNLSDANRVLGLYEEGIRQMKEALEIWERINDVVRQAVCLKDLALLLFSDKQLDDAENAASRAIDLIAEKGREYTTCGLHRVLGQIHQSKGTKEKAIHHYKTALGIASAFNWRDELCWSHYSLADQFRSGGQFDDANAHVKQGKSYAADGTYQLGRTMKLQANIWYQEHRLEDAKSEALHALGIYEKLGATKDAEVCRDLLQDIERAIETRTSDENAAN